MTHIKSTILAALLLAATATCACAESSLVDDGQAEGAVVPTIAISELPSQDAQTLLNPFAEQSPELSFTAELDAQLIEDFGDVCECAADDGECQSRWVEATFGCDFCAFTTCGDGLRLGSCVVCD